MENIQLIASDMDHTLLTEKGELPPDFNSDILALEQLGVSFAIASGRPLYTLTNLFSELNEKMIFISDNGGLISYKGKIIFKSLISPVDYKTMIHFVEEQTNGIAILCGLDSAYLSEKHKKYAAFLRTFYTNITFVEDIQSIQIDIDKFTIYFPENDSKVNYHEKIMPKFNEKFSVTIGDTIWIDIMNKGVDKGQAMAILGEKLGIDSSQMMAFGDTYNDKEMLQYVKYSYIVGNADEDMKQYAQFVTKTNDEYGVTKVIEELIEIKNNLR
ncbi:haloacid dehalogenase [Enterococcus silesiacus]|nr:HAD family hydrolase [Enterococcus silesiacus]ALS02071.1 haloacid dehalogenase [Enterococcus silesiacus]